MSTISISYFIVYFIQCYYLYVGLCGDFNDIEADDFRTTNGLTEGTAVTFANTWKTKTSCPDVTNILGDPCILSVDKGGLTVTDIMLHLCHSSQQPTI